MNNLPTSQKLNRRKFIKTMGLSATALAIAPNLAFTHTTVSPRKIRMGIIGGRFGLGFQFHKHPNCIVEAVSDLRTDRKEALMKGYECTKSYNSLEILLKDPKVDAVFIATGAPDHARHVIESLNAGKHVLCAVPAAMTLDECNEILNKVKSTGLTYMMAETSIWRQSMISAKKFYQEGAFGNLMSYSAQYTIRV